MALLLNTLKQLWLLTSHGFTGYWKFLVGLMCSWGCSQQAARLSLDDQSECHLYTGHSSCLSRTGWDDNPSLITEVSLCGHLKTWFQQSETGEISGSSSTSLSPPSTGQYWSQGHPRPKKWGLYLLMAHCKITWAQAGEEILKTIFTNNLPQWGEMESNAISCLTHWLLLTHCARTHASMLSAFIWHIRLP